MEAFWFWSGLFSTEVTAERLPNLLDKVSIAAGMIFKSSFTDEAVTLFAPLFPDSLEM